MVTYVRGNLFESPAQTLVNTVNTVGVMGKGVALEFKRLFPDMFREYKQLCEARRLKIGTLHIYRTPHKYVLNFPTKTTWRQPSRVQYIEAGLRRLAATYEGAGILSLAMPPIGCGNGQLDWKRQVEPLVQKYLGSLPIPVYIYPARAATSPPEHMNEEAMREWLRSEPSSLPFDEVWPEIVERAGSERTFRTPTEGNSYTAAVCADPPELAIETSAGKKQKFEHDVLLEFWQKLSQHGIAFRSATPKYLELSYLAPIFELLPYVHRVGVASSAEGLARPWLALQVVPPVSDGPLFQHQAG